MGDLLRLHSDTVIFNGHKNVGEPAFFYCYKDIPSALGLDPVENGVLYQRLEGEPGNQA
ncbi:hypothetical protein D3C71_2207220 [compost metagenome]